MKLAQCGSDPSPLGRLPADFFHAQGLQIGQSADEAFSRFNDRRLRPATHPVGRHLPPRRKLNQPTLLQLHQQRAGCHVLELTGRITPIPTRGQLPR